MDTQNILDVLKQLPDREAALILNAISKGQNYPNVEFQKVSISIASTGQQVSITSGTRTEKKYIRIIGLALTIGDTAALPLSTFKLQIGNKRVFDGEEATLIYSTNDVAPNERYYSYINREVNESEIEGWFKDGGSTSGSFSAYTVNIYLMCIKEDE